MKKYLILFCLMAATMALPFNVAAQGEYDDSWEDEISTMRDEVERMARSIDAALDMDERRDGPSDDSLTSMRVRLDRVRAKLETLEIRNARDYAPTGLFDDMLDLDGRRHLPSEAISFGYNSDVLNGLARRKLMAFARVIKNSPKSEVFYIIGSVDSRKKSPRQSRKLCKRRCEAVYQMLVKECGVPKRRLVMLPDGGWQEYAPQRGRNTVVIIQGTPDSDEVLERWIPRY